MDEPADPWQRGDPYERYVGRWSRRVAPLFLDWLGEPAGRRWLDVGCGTGALGAAILFRCAPAALTGVEPSPGFLAVARRQLGGAATLREGSATALPLEPATVDVVVSGLVLNFVADVPAALAEMIRVAARGATVAAYVWDYTGTMDLMRLYWEAAAEIDPSALRLDEGRRFTICRPEALAAAWTGAGLAAVETTPIDIATDFASFDDYWQPFLGGQGPAPAHAMSLDEQTRARLRERLRERVGALPGGAASMKARAWAVRGRTAG